MGGGWGTQTGFFSPETSSLILMIQITNTCMVGLHRKTFQWNAYNQKHSDETKQKAQRRSEARTQENHNGNN